MQLRKRSAAVLLTIVLLACGFAPAPTLAQDAQVAAATQPETQSWEVIDDDWMIVEIGGGRVGWSNTRVEQFGEQFRTVFRTDITVSRGDASTHMLTDSTFIETADGKPISMSYMLDASLQPSNTRWEFKGDKVTEISRKGGRETTKEVDAPQGEWMTRYQSLQYARQQRREGAKEITLQTVGPETGLTVFSTTSKRTGETEYEVGGQKKSVSVWKTTTDVMPIEVTEYYDADGEPVYMQIPAPGIGNMVMRTVSKVEALVAIEGGGPELLISTFVTPDKPIDRPAKALKAKLKLTARQGALPDLPSAGSQRVETSDDRKSAVLTIDINDELPASDEEKADAEYVNPSTMVDFDDELVTKLSNAAKDHGEVIAKAEALRRIVYKRIGKKGMETIFASASETAKTQTGDCSEHGVLLAALLRAQHIPARVAMGLVYVDEFMGGKGIFGWHMWTQALIDGKWVDLDATLPVRYHAGHVLTNTSSLADGLGAADMVSIMQLIGNIDIEVVEVEHAE